MLRELLHQSSSLVEHAMREGSAGPQLREIGVVENVEHAVAQVRGLPGLPAEALVRFRGGLLGMAVDLGARSIGVVLLGPSGNVRAGDIVHAASGLVDAPVGEALLGRVLDATGRPLDGNGPIEWSQRRPIERAAPAIMDRAPVTTPLQTGIKVIDALLPIGRGQRELIVGDRQTGKTAIAVDTILNQRNGDVICIYCAIGQRGTAVARVIETLRRHGALEHSIVVVGLGEDAPGLQFVTPYAATTMAEYFMEQGQDVLIVYDDLTRHARAYREISLLLRRPPGREAFPGDIFYIHSRLLERATRLRKDKGGGSLTALPIVETQSQDISAYIPTNLISITDGQIYVSPDLFRKGFMPAVDVGRSVSRVGGKAQLPAYHAVTADLRLSYSRFEELETFSRFATRLDEETRATIERGRRVREALKQPEHAPLAVADQIIVLRATAAGLFDELALEELSAAQAALTERMRAELPDFCQKLETGTPLEDREWTQVLEASRQVLDDIAAGKGT